MELHVIAAFLFATYITYIGLTRIVIQSGLVFVRAPITAQSFTTSAIGPANMSAASLTSLGASFAWVHTVFFFMPAMAHAARLQTELRIRRRHVLGAVALGVIVATAISVYVTLYWGYDLGGDNFRGWAFGGGKTRHWDSIMPKLRSPSGVDRPALVQFGFGGAAMWAVTLLMYRVPGWPVHPIGLTIAYTHPTSMIAFSVLITWLVKWTILRIGGRRLFVRAKPLFLGLIIGYFTGLAIGVAVDWLWFGPGSGHPMFSL